MAFLAGGVRLFRKDLHLHFRFLNSSHTLQNLSPQVVSAFALGIEFDGRINFGERLRIFVLALIYLGQLETRAGHLWIES